MALPGYRHLSSAQMASNTLITIALTNIMNRQDNLDNAERICRSAPAALSTMVVRFAIAGDKVRLNAWAKAADDVGDERGSQDATDLLGHESQRTTSRHYRRRGTIVHATR